MEQLLNGRRTRLRIRHQRQSQNAEQSQATRKANRFRSQRDGSCKHGGVRQRRPKYCSARLYVQIEKEEKTDEITSHSRPRRRWNLESAALALALSTLKDQFSFGMLRAISPMSASKASNSERFLLIDALRGIAALRFCFSSGALGAEYARM